MVVSVVMCQIRVLIRYSMSQRTVTSCPVQYRELPLETRLLQLSPAPQNLPMPVELVSTKKTVDDERLAQCYSL